ncbi:MAG: tetraacyldisaccharide 4'-kinase [Bacteroidetes bacterium]|nr:tetraacyldisaccharide 4'-kinase [Bacteroidota bacterium]
MNITGLLLLPFAIIYGLIVFVRNKFFDFGILKQKSFVVPVISVGNLSAGGTGKTPHIEYLIKLLEKEYKLATLSRGYGRKTKGFKLVDEAATAIDVGDEPLQYKRKFPEIFISIDENRVNGISTILEQQPDTDIVLLDDAFQHRYVKPGLSILLTDYYKPFSHDYLLPSGTLREYRTGMKRADIIVVSKCPNVLSPISCKAMESDMKVRKNQNVYYSYVDYGDLVPMNTVAEGIKTRKFSTVLVFAGIANPYPMEDELKSCADKVIVEKFRDHYQYQPKDMLKIQQHFESIFSKNKIIVTTEKDAMRIQNTPLMNFFVNLPLFYLPIEVKFHKKSKEKFDKQILTYVRTNKANH